MLCGRFAQMPRTEVEWDIYSRYYKINATALGSRSHPRLRLLSERSVRMAQTFGGEPDGAEAPGRPRAPRL